MLDVLSGLSKVLEAVFVFLLLAGVPFLSLTTTREAQVRQLPRLALYFSAAVSQWVLAALGIVVVLVTTRNFRETGFRPLAAGLFIAWTSVLAAVSIGALVLVLLLERWGWWPPESDLVYLLLPETPRERIWALLILAPTAAFCEEYLYRGFLLAKFSHLSQSFIGGLIISSIAFGMAHVYQGVRGVARASLLGAFLAYPVVKFGSIYPSIAAHFLIDAVALTWLGPSFLRRTVSFINAFPLLGRRRWLKRE